MAFEGKVAIVTGGGHGIGKSYCLALLNEGMKVCICDINEDTTAEFIKNLPESIQKKILFHKCDVTQYDDLKDAFETTIRKFGKIDLVVNNAGIVDEIDWKKTIEVNMVGVIHGIQLGFKYMGVDNGGSGGWIVNTASRAGFKHMSVAPVYCATKYGVIGLTKSYGSDYHFKKSGVTVNAVCPGAVDTPMFQNYLSKALDTEVSLKSVENKIFVTAEEVGKGLIKLLKDNKNGSLLRVDEFGFQYM